MLNKVEIIKVSLLAIIVVILFSIGSRVEVMDSKVERMWNIQKQSAVQATQLMKSMGHQVIELVKEAK